MLPLLSLRSLRGGGGGGFRPNVYYVGMCCFEGYGFKQFSLPIKENYILLLKNEK